MTAPTSQNEKDSAWLAAYCSAYCKMITRYATPAELQALQARLEGFKDEVMASRYAPGLNDAAYDLFAKFNLKQSRDAHNGATGGRNGN